MRSEDFKYITTKFFDNDIYTFPMTVDDLLDIQYVASRGKSTEQGAVQRILNKRRISQIRDFILEGNSFVNTFILNWTDTDNPPKIKKETLNLPLQGRRAQILDGQHRIAGMQEAVNKNPQIGKIEVLVSLCIGLNTQEAAKIFLNINSEQKPVPKSLIYDLFGEAVDDKEHAIIRATDIIEYLNSSDESPYYQAVKYPGAPRNIGLIDLAIMVNAMKPHFEKDAVFSRLKLYEIEVQKKIITNFYSAIKSIYNKSNKIWSRKTENPFIKAAGFSGAFEFLTETLMPRCQTDKNFTTDHMLKLMKLDPDDLITTSDFRTLDGKTARKNVKNFFNDCFLKDIPTSTDDYEF
ncbi:DGQHR domain-containing protein [uncultured Draconibacterium sp.]|uniref:DGQHR domain-containing protein n=1 Tax=uncultured Draconibacterium sp. TaxID=1573823 RepID=UPI00321803F8